MQKERSDTDNHIKYEEENNGIKEKEHQAKDAEHQAKTRSAKPGIRDYGNGRGQTQDRDKVGAYREAISDRTGNQDGEGRGQAKTRHTNPDSRDYVEGRGQTQTGGRVDIYS